MMLKGDCIEVMKAMKPNSVDAIVTDPPYNLHFMAKDWDKDLLHEKWLTEAYRVLKPGASMLVMGGTRTSHRLACAIEDTGFIIKDTLMWIYGSGFPKAQDLGKMIDKRAGKEREVIGIKTYLRNGTTPVTRKATSIYSQGGGENVGQDSNVETAPTTDLAKHWDGFKVGGIKPSYEPIIWAVKPPEGSYMDNVLKWGVGAVNVDETRIGFNGNKPSDNRWGKNSKAKTDNAFFGQSCYEVQNYDHPKGRFPANIILSHHPECVQVGVKMVKGGQPFANPTCGFHDSLGRDRKIRKDKAINRADPDGFETVESWDCHPDCAVRLLDEQSGNRKTSGQSTRGKIRGNGIFGQIPDGEHYGDNGGASRFFYCAKAARSERNAGLEGMEKKEAFNYGHKENPGRVAPKKSYPRTNNHPTVKPIKLFEWLIKLVTREGQIVLDPFIGSGTTAIAAHNVGRKCMGIEKEEEYLEIARRRIKHCENQPKQMEMRV